MQSTAVFASILAITHLAGVIFEVVAVLGVFAVDLLTGQVVARMDRRERNELAKAAQGIPPQPVSAGFGFVPHKFDSLLDVSGRRVCIGLRSRRFRSSAGSGPRQEEQCTPAHFLVEFGTASLECQPYPFHLVFGRHFAEGAVDLQRCVSS